MYLRMARVVPRFFDWFSNEILKSPDYFESGKENPIENFDWIEIDTNPEQE